MEVKRENAANDMGNTPCAVSILVLMEVKREKFGKPTGVGRTWVSILVLMEVKRESSRGLLKNPGICFNPCFDGSEARD